MTEANGSDIATGNPLWEFSTWAYSQQGVDKALLSLQSRMGADVNMVLFCMWLAHRGSDGNDLAQHLAGAVKMSREWQRNLVEPLRNCRDQLKLVIDGPDLVGRNRESANALRERLKANELDMEALQILGLYALVSTGEDDEGAPVDIASQKEDAQNNLNVYFAAIGIELDHLAQSDVLRVLNGVFQ